MKIVRFSLFIAALFLCTSAFAQIKKCEDLKAEIEGKLNKKRVVGYSLEIVPSDQIKDQKVVGSCDGGTNKIAYAREATISGDPKPAAQAAAAKKCDRACLVALMDNYLAAIVKHDPAGVPLASDVKLVENLNATPIGKGLWETATGGPTNFKIYAADPDTEQIGFIGVIEENKKPTIASVRLKIENGQITEIDHLVVHNEDGKPLNPNMSKVRPALLERLPKLERVHRDQMKKIANSYYEAIVQDNGKVAPFADECQRRENGGISANDRTQTPEEAAKDDFSTFRKMTCSDQLSTGVMSYITDINRRRVFAVDEENGLVFAYSIFVHDGKPKVMKIIGVPGVTERKNDYGPFDLPASHIFKIRNGKIYEIEAIGYMAKHGIKNGWE